jgi:RimJ/RimL family protein N-acetyltransferase
METHGPYSRTALSLPAAPFESDRLHFRPMDERDEPVLWRLLSDENVLKYIGLPVETDRELCRSTVFADFEKGVRFKFFLSVRWKDASLEDEKDMIGWVLFRPEEDEQSVEIGYWFLPTVWGRGVATEAATAVANHCAAGMKIPFKDISAKVMIGNGASRRVLEKSGLRVTHTGKESLPRGGEADIWILAWDVG